MELHPDRAYCISTSGEIKEISPENGKGFELEEAQAYVEGYIEVINLSEEQIMIINEEGKYDKEYNAIATGIADLHHALLPGDYVCGNVIICPSQMLP
ncbi:MAG: DUF3846 domain-containing protein [Muribaculaceae bacterium]|nr:DUF3846 domain-containing protein [Muribaculaceae bacterium]